MSFLESEEISLRTLEPTDIDLLNEWENNIEIWHLSNTQKPFSRHVLQSFIEEASQDIYTTKFLRLIICLNKTNPIGTIDFFDFDPFHLRAGLGILIAKEEYRNLGYADKSLQLIIKYANDVLHLNQLFCNINADNSHSLKLFQRNGFIVSGNKQKWNKTKAGFMDEYFLQLIF